MLASVTTIIREEKELCLKNVAEIVCTNFGEYKAMVNGRTVLPQRTITFAKCFWIPHIKLEITFPRSGTNRYLEISYLVRDDDSNTT